MGPWNGYGHSTNNESTGGCSSLGVDSEGQFGLVYKATSKHGGIYRNLSKHTGAPHHLVNPISVFEIPTMGMSY